MANNFNMIDHHVSALVRAVRDGETDGKAVMRAMKSELAKLEREVSLEAERLKAFSKDILLESETKSWLKDRDYQKSEHYWDTERNKDPYRLSSDYLSFGSASSEDVIKFDDYTNDAFKDWTS